MNLEIAYCSVNVSGTIKGVAALMARMKVLQYVWLIISVADLTDFQCVAVSTQL